jgi:hypothetical protein
VSEAYTNGVEDPPPESHCPVSTFSDLKPMGIVTAAGIFQSGGGGDSGSTNDSGKKEKSKRCPRCRSNRHTTTVDCPLAPAPKDLDDQKAMKTDDSKFSVGKDSTDGGFRVSCWQCNRWGHGTNNCPK